MSENRYPPAVEQAIGLLILYGLGKGMDVDVGFRLIAGNISFGQPPDDIPAGDWKITVQRTKTS